MNVTKHRQGTVRFRLGMDEGEADAAARWWTFNRPLSQQQNPTRVEPSGNWTSISSKKMRWKRNVRACGTSSSITTITHQLRIPPATRFARNSTPQRKRWKVNSPSD